MTKSVPAITTEEARAIIDGALAKGAALNLQPLAVTVLDAGGHMKAFLRQDGASNQRFEISRGKAARAKCILHGSAFGLAMSWRGTARHDLDVLVSSGMFDLVLDMVTAFASAPRRRPTPRA